MSRMPLQRSYFLAIVLLFLVHAQAWAEPAAKVYVILWFDTEDYILPASDDAALKVADFLTKEGVRATFKIVGEKARTLERRGRTDVIEALKKHEIGYHSNWHSVQPSPAMFMSTLGWDEGVAEFDRREKPGYDDVKRIFGVAPSCYGQPGSSWGPQSFGAMRKWNMPVYLDAGSHVQLDNKPFYYCGILTLYKLAHVLRTGLASPNDLKEAEDRFLQSRDKLIKEGGGVVSIYYHPCEFVHKEFWDGVNFRNGANPPRDKWKLPPQKTAEESKVAYENFENYVRFIKRFQEVEFITALDSTKLYRDKAQGRVFHPQEIKAIATKIGDGITYYQGTDFTLSAAEVFALLNTYVMERSSSRNPQDFTVTSTPYGPAQPTTPLTEKITIPRGDFRRAMPDVADYLHRHQRIPTTIWIGSLPVPPESYLRALAELAIPLADAQAPPDTVDLKPTRLAIADNVSDDDPKLWGWVIFPRGFRAPEMMKLAKRQAWTLKPALLSSR